MLGVRFHSARNIRCPSSTSDDPGVMFRWAVKIQHGSQHFLTRFVELDNHCTTEIGASSEKLAPWDEEFEIQDKEGRETIEIALLVDVTLKGALVRKRFKHSITTIEMRTFRAQPERRVSMWQQLRSITTVDDEDFGELQLTAMYSDDICVSQGYMFGLFCGLTPPCFSPPQLMDIPCTSGSVREFIVQHVKPHVAAESLEERSDVVHASLKRSPTPLLPVDKLELATEKTTALTPPPKVEDDISRGFVGTSQQILLGRLR